MNWRDPSKELPENNQSVYVMLRPHKWRDSMIKSAASIEIVAGWYFKDKGSVENIDELGMGAIEWYLDPKIEDSEDCPMYYYTQQAIAWIPVEEMNFPSFFKD